MTSRRIIAFAAVLSLLTLPALGAFAVDSKSMSKEQFLRTLASSDSRADNGSHVIKAGPGTGEKGKSQLFARETEAESCSGTVYCDSGLCTCSGTFGCCAVGCAVTYVVACEEAN